MICRVLFQGGGAHSQSWTGGGSIDWQTEQISHQCSQHPETDDYRTVSAKINTVLTSDLPVLWAKSQFTWSSFLIELFYKVCQLPKSTAHVLCISIEIRQQIRTWCTCVSSLSWSPPSPNCALNYEKPRECTRTRFVPNTTDEKTVLTLQFCTVAFGREGLDSSWSFESQT